MKSGHVLLSLLAYLFIAGLRDLLCGAGNFGKIWSPCGQLDTKYTKLRLNMCKYNYLYIILPARSALNHVK